MKEQTNTDFSLTNKKEENSLLIPNNTILLQSVATYCKQEKLDVVNENTICYWKIKQN